MNDTIPELKIELMADGKGDGLILLEQDSGGNIDRVAIHPIHLRYMAEKMGLVVSSDPTAAKTIATLQRRMVALRDRIESLADWMALHSDHKHADLSHETTQLAAMEDLAREWCCDFEGDTARVVHPDTPEPTQTKPTANPPSGKLKPAKPPVNGQLDLAGA